MDYRNRLVRVARINADAVGEPHGPEEIAKLHQVGKAVSLYVDGRRSHDEGYMVEFPDRGEITQLSFLADELEPVASRYQTGLVELVRSYAQGEQKRELNRRDFEEAGIPADEIDDLVDLMRNAGMCEDRWSSGMLLQLKA